MTGFWWVPDTPIGRIFVSLHASRGTHRWEGTMGRLGCLHSVTVKAGHLSFFIILRSTYYRILSRDCHRYGWMAGGLAFSGGCCCRFLKVDRPTLACTGCPYG